MTYRVALLTLVAAAAPVSAGAVPFPARPASDTAAIRKADEATLKQLKLKADEAVFRKVAVRGDHVCGEVSARRGPYVRFVYTSSNGGLNVDDGHFTNMFNFVWNGSCAPG